MSLTYGRRGPERAKRLVVFLHGYGANGADLLSLADPLMPHLPETAFLAPDAPDACAGNPMGFHWFPIPWLDGSSQDAAEAAAADAADKLNAFLDERMEAEGVSAAQTILLGFSQGTMMTLEVAPRRAEPFAGLVCFSGRLMRAERLAAETVSKPPVLLIHGDKDDVVPFSSMQEAGSALQASGFEVYGHVMQGTAHGIAPDGLQVALAFMRKEFGLG